MKLTYRELFLAHNGPGPWPCAFCEDEVTIEKFCVHHVDGVHENNAIENLAPAHGACHARHHATGVRRPLSDKHKAAIGRARRGKPLTAAHRAKVGDGVRKSGVNGRRYQCGECPIVTTAGALGRHQAAAGHIGRTDA